MHTTRGHHEVIAQGAAAWPVLGPLAILAGVRVAQVLSGALKAFTRQ